MKIYKMIVEHLKNGERRAYIAKRQGEHPAGWKTVSVCGCIETRVANEAVR